MTISICMIVKNEEELLSKTLSSNSKLADELIIVDTGSIDNTVAIAQKFNAKIFHFDWINDFSAARNESLKSASSDWIITLDADEIIRDEDHEKIKSVLSNSQEVAYFAKISECPYESFEPTSFNLRPKIFRNNLGIHFERAINEQIMTKDEKLIASFAKDIGVPIYHWGNFRDEKRMSEKRDFYINLLEQASKDRPEDIAYHLLLGKNYKNKGLNEKAIAEFDLVVKYSKDTKYIIEARAEKAWLLYSMRMFKEANGEVKEVLALNQYNVTIRNLMATMLISVKKYEEAIKILEEIKDRPVENDSVISDVSQKEYLSNFLLATAYFYLGYMGEAKKYLESALKFSPSSKEALELSHKFFLS